MFQEQNASVLNYPKETLPENMRALAQISSYNPERLLQFLKEYKDRFSGIKIFAAMPLPVDDNKFNDIWKFAEKQNWSVTVHCNGNLRNFIAIFVVAQKFPKVKFIASHLGGTNPKTTDEILLIKKLNRDFPQNLFFNTATPDYDSIQKMVEAFPEKIVHASDVPFCKLWGKESSLQKAVIAHYERVQNIIREENCFTSV